MTCKVQCINCGSSNVDYGENLNEYADVYVCDECGHETVVERYFRDEYEELVKQNNETKENKIIIDPRGGRRNNPYAQGALEACTLKNILEGKKVAVPHIDGTMHRIELDGDEVRIKLTSFAPGLSGEYYTTIDEYQDGHTEVKNHYEEE